MADDPKQPEERPNPDRPDGSGPNPGNPLGLVGIGLEFLGTILVVGAIGWFLDRKFQTFPWLTIVGGALGFGAGLMSVIRAGRSAFKD